MKSHSMNWSPIATGNSRAVLNPMRLLPGLLQLMRKAFLALVPALAIVVGAAWLITLPDLVLYLQVLIWVSGFIFLGLAVESESAEMAILNLATGIALPVLAMLSSRVAIEFTVVAAALVAAWVAAAIVRR